MKQKKTQTYSNNNKIVENSNQQQAPTAGQSSYSDDGETNDLLEGKINRGTTFITNQQSRKFQTNMPNIGQSKISTKQTVYCPTQSPKISW